MVSRIFYLLILFTAAFLKTSSAAITIDATSVTTRPSACNSNTGAILGIVVSGSGSLVMSWKDQSGTQWGTAANLTDIPAGSYTLTVTSDDGSPTQTYGPVVVSNTLPPVINQTNAVITSTLCGQFTGSIINVTANGTGPLTYSWLSQFDTEVSNSLPLLNKTGGKYRLKVTDANGCSTIGAELEIPEINSVSLNTTNGRVTSASCERNNGAITGLQAMGATQITWNKKEDNALVSTVIDLINMPAGNYVLTLKNAICSKSYDFSIGALASSTFGDIMVTVTNTCEAFVSGKIEVNTDNAVEVPAAYRWVNSAGDNAAFGKIAQSLPEGKYRLYLTNKFGCENLYGEYTVAKYPEFVNTQFGTVTNIKCGIGRGSITGIAFTGGTGNYVYQWFNTDGSLMADKTEPFLDDLAPGRYTLRTTDGGCGLSENVYTIVDEAVPQAPPVVPDVTVLDPGQATIAVTDPFATAIYRLYDSASATTPIDEQRGGIFNVNVTRNTTYYVVLTFGYCESDRVAVNVTVAPNARDIANTFTPNGDGINDFWRINGLNGSTSAVVSVFSRHGKLIFQSTGYATPFDGTYQGKQLPAGVYYYIIKLAGSKNISGSLTILR